MHVRFLSINLQYLIFTFGVFTRMRKSVKSAACFFYTCHHEVKVVILHPFFLQRFCQQIMYHLVCPLSCSFCKKYWQILHTSYYGKIQLLAINHLWKACFMLYAICTSCRVECTYFVTSISFTYFLERQILVPFFSHDKLETWYGLKTVASAQCLGAMILKFSVIAEPLVNTLRFLI